MDNIELKILLLLLIIGHHISCLLLIIAPFYLIVYEPFWIWLPLNIWILHVIFSPVLVCPGTMWENRLRRRLGMPEIKTFFKHYYIEPLKNFLENTKGNSEE